MNRYPTHELSLWQLFKQSFRLHYLTLKHSIFFILVLTLVKFGATLLLNYFSNYLVQDAIFFIAILLGVFFFSAALFAAHESFTDHSRKLIDVLTEIKGNLVNIYAAFIAYLAIIVGSNVLANLLNMLVRKLLTNIDSPVYGATTIISLVIILMAIGMFSLIYPLAVIDKKKIRNAFHDSLLLSDRSKFGLLALFFMLIVINLLVSPRALQEYFLSSYYLSPIFDFIVLCVMIPLFINFLLLLINDAKLQVKEEG